MSTPSASCKKESDQRASDREHTDEHAESLTDLMDVLQRQSFTRRFEPRTDSQIVERDLRSESPTARAASRSGPSG